MELEEATSLIWRVLDGEADEGERAALDAAGGDIAGAVDALSHA